MPAPVVAAAAKIVAKRVVVAGAKKIHQKSPGGLIGFIAILSCLTLVGPLLLAAVIFSSLHGQMQQESGNCFGGASVASPVAAQDIPQAALDAYQKAGAATGIDWVYIAAIGKIEGRHGSANGATLGADGKVTPPILGPRLDGSGVGGNRTAYHDTDFGRLDGDTSYDRAVGPMQFMPQTWNSLAHDGNFDGLKDPQNIYDAALSAAKLLQRNGAPGNMEDAIFRYNRSRAYVQHVVSTAMSYQGIGDTQIVPAGPAAPPAPDAPIIPAANPATGSGSAWVSPMPPGTKMTSKFGPRESPGGIGSTNHRGVDFGPGHGAPIYAVGAGTVLSAGSGGGYGNLTKIQHGGGVETWYAHQDTMLAAPGQTVQAGQQIGTVGSTGTATGPHLHFEVRVNGVPQDPGPWLNGQGVYPDFQPTGGCSGSLPGVPASNAVTSAVLTFADAQKGKPYVWGATGPNAFDCSGLTSQAYLTAGVKIPRTAGEQWMWDQTQRIPAGQEQPGDLVFFITSGNPQDPGHVGIVLDPAAQTMIHAPGRGKVVEVASYGARQPLGFGRMPGGGGPAIDETGGTDAHVELS